MIKKTFQKKKELPKNKKELHCELVPKTCWYSNVRDHVKQSQWDKIRRDSYAKANYKCEICGGSGKDYGRKHDVECHEIWHWNDAEKIQTLIGLISLCPKCHEVKHYGRATILGNDKRARFWLKTINTHWEWRDVFKHVEQSIETYKERSKHNWILNMDFLKEHYDLDVEIHRQVFTQEEIEDLNNSLLHKAEDKETNNE